MKKGHSTIISAVFVDKKKVSFYMRMRYELVRQKWLKRFIKNLLAPLTQRK